MNKVRIATVGTNFIVDLFCDAVTKLTDVEVSAAYSRQAETGARFARKQGIPKVYTEYDALLSDTEIDAIYVASPTFLHCEHSVRALEAGKHVLCEKSISTSFEEFKKMREASERANRVLLEAMRPAHSPLIKTLRDNLYRVGNIEFARLSFLKYSSRYDNFKRGIIENAFNPEMKNSALSDIGVYPVWLSVSLFGEPKRVEAYSKRLSNGFDGEGRVNMIYDVLEVEINYSKIRDDDAPSYIRGDEGTIYVDKISEPRSVTFSDSQGQQSVIAIDLCENNMIYEIKSFVEMIRGETSHFPFFEESERLSRTMERIETSRYNIE